MESKSISEAQRQFLSFHAPWPISFHTFKGEHLESSPGRDNLFELIINRERFMCDSNSAWKGEVCKPDNEKKAFILGHTVLDETDDVQGNLFGKKVNHTYNNIFIFTFPPCPDGVQMLAIERFDDHFPERFNKDQIY